VINSLVDRTLRRFRIFDTQMNLRGEHRLGAFENRVLRRIFGPKSDEIIGGWRKLRNEILHREFWQEDSK
jgi:hypothetical protein